MSGDSEAPPTYYFSGITFNPTFYTETTSGNYLTATTGKKYFLSYPTAQGEETISRLYTSQVSTSTPTDAFNFLDSLTGNLYIGENASGTTGQIIQIGAKTLTTVKLGALSIKESTIETLAPSTAFNFLASQTANLNIGNTTTGTSGQVIKIGPSATTTITVGDISVSGSSINNATNSTNRGVKIGDAQSDAAADLNLGTHINRLGEINIGTGNNTAAPIINIGATLLNGIVRAGAIINIGRMTTNAITIGNASADVNIYSSSGSIKTGTFACVAQTASGLITANNGITIPSGKTLTANGGITISGDNYITLGTPVTAPTSSQLGYFINAVSSTTLTIQITSTATDIVTVTFPTIGIYWVCFNHRAESWNPAASTNYVNYNLVKTNCTTTMISTGCVGSNTLSSCSFSGVVVVTAASATLKVQGYTNVSGYTTNVPPNTGAQIQAIRIA